MNGLTVEQLCKYCVLQMRKGNGNKIVCVSDDEEGNGFHAIFYQFTDDKQSLKEYKEMGILTEDIDNIVLLG